MPGGGLGCDRGQGANCEAARKAIGLIENGGNELRCCKEGESVLGQSRSRPKLAPSVYRVTGAVAYA